MMDNILITLVEKTLHLIHESCLKALTTSVAFNNLREPLARGIATVCHAAEPMSHLRHTVLLELLAELKRVRSAEVEGEVSLLAKDDMLWYLQNLIGEVVELVGPVEGIVRHRIEESMWEILSDEAICTVKGCWITWCVGGIVCGIANLEYNRSEK